MNDLLIIVGLAIAVYVALRVYKSTQRKKAIFAHQEEWGGNICETIFEKKIRPGMTKEMVQLSWGKPRGVDKREITASGEEKIRWVYGTPRKNARYIYFKQGQVTKIQT